MPSELVSPSLIYLGEIEQRNSAENLDKDRLEEVHLDNEQPSTPLKPSPNIQVPDSFGHKMIEVNQLYQQSAPSMKFQTAKKVRGGSSFNSHE